MKAGAVVAVVMVTAMASCLSYAESRPEIGLLAQCNELMTFMESNDPDAEVTMAMGLCIGTIDGVLKTMKAMNKRLSKPFQTCFPERGVAMTVAVREVVQYLRASELTDTDDATLAMFAIQEIYPCKE